MALERRKTKTSPKVWTKTEEKKLYEYLIQGNVSLKDIQKEFPDRSMVSLRSKIRKLRIKHDIFGNSYRVDKERFTINIAETIKPQIVFDAYSGAGHQTLQWINYANIVFASEISKQKYNMLIENLIVNDFKKVKGKFENWLSFKKGQKYIHTFNGDAVKAAAYISVYQNSIDLVDLDTCGTTIPTLPIYLNLLRPKYVVITHGEYHSLRFDREDVLRRVLCHRSIMESPGKLNDFNDELDKAVKTSSIRAHNEIKDSFYPQIIDEIWLGEKTQGMLRRLYKIGRPVSAADCINEISNQV